MKSFNDLKGIHQRLERKRLDAERQAELDRAAKAKATAEANLFRTSMQDVKPLLQNNRANHQLPKPVPRPIQRELDEQEALIESLSDEMDVERFLETDDKLSYRVNGIGQETLRKLRRGQWVIQAQIDLHGLRSDEARQAISEFIRSSVQYEVRCVRIIHGKGLGSIGKEPVLKEKVKRWLVQKQEVLAFCQAPPRDGGAGALLVLLKSK